MKAATDRNTTMARVRDWVRSKHMQGLFLASAGMASISPAHAVLPEVEAPSRGEGSGIIELIQNYGYDLILVVALILCAFGFLSVAYHSFNVYGAVQNNKSTWGQFGTTVAVGAVLLVLVIWLATKASEIL